MRAGITRGITYMQKFLKAGVVLKPQGIRGEIKVKPQAQLPLNINAFTIDGVVYPVKNISLRQGYLYILLEGIDSRNDAENLRNKEIFVNIKEEPFPEGVYYTADLISCEVYKNGKLLGRITDVLSHGAADVIVISEEEIMFPHIKGIFLNVDIKKKRADINETIFDSVAVIR